MKLKLNASLLILSLAQLGGAGVLMAQDFDQYGGYTGVTQEAKGYFTLGESNGRHCFFTPEGNAFLSIGLNHWHTTSRTDYDQMITEVKSWGFNSGDYQGPGWMWDRIPYTKGINLMENRAYASEEDFGFEDVFDPVYLAALDSKIKSTVEPQAEKQMLIGYFLTDMPVWANSKYGTSWLQFFKNLAEDAPGGLVWTNWKADNAGVEEEDFLGVIAQQLYSEATAMVRKYDPNHLVFTERFNENDLPEVVLRAAMQYVDVIATQPLNQYHEDYFDWLYRTSGMPIFIADHVSSFATTEYPVTMGQVAQDEESYFDFYRDYVGNIWTLPFLVGFNKCQYQDQDQGTLLKQGLLMQNEQPHNYVSGLNEVHSGALEKAYTTQLDKGIPPAPGDWEISFEDEFDLEHVDPDRWRQGQRVCYFNGLASNDGNQIQVNNGALELVAEKRDGVFSGKAYSYASGELTTFRKFRQLYGYFEARMKYEGKQGSWPAFWLMPDDGNRGSEDAIREAYLRFDLSDVTQPVSSAELRFRISSMSSENCGFTVHRLLSDDWSETSLTWDNKPQADPVWVRELYSTSDGSKVDQFNAGDLMILDVTDEVRHALTTGTGLGFKIWDPFKRSVEIQLHSKESANTADHPTLVIDGQSREASDDAFVRGGQYAGTNYGSTSYLSLQDPWIANQGTENGGMEMDIMETLGIWGEDQNSNALHWDGYGEDHKSVGSKKYSVPPSSDGYHVYGLLWKPGKVEFYVDGVQKWEWENERVGSVPAYVFLSHQMGGWDGNTEIIDEQLPATVWVDYVRVYRNNTGARIRITEPLDGSTHSAGSSVLTTASLEEWGAVISRVDFLLDNELIGSDSEAPYQLQLPSKDRGRYTLVVRAISASGEALDEDSVSLTYANAPAVTLSSPVDSSIFHAPAVVNIRAEVSPADADATVEFLLNGNLISTDTETPYELSLDHVLPDRYTLEAVVTDELGLRAEASPVFFKVSGGPIPEPFVMEDIGSPELPGDGSFYEGSFYFEGSGNDPSRKTDKLNYIYQGLGDTCMIQSRLIRVDDADGRGIAGLVMRENLDVDAPMIGIFTSSEGVHQLLYRSVAGMAMGSIPIYPEIEFPVWLKIERSAELFACYTSSDSLNWSKVLGKNFPIDMKEQILGGMAITSLSNDSYAYSTMDETRVEGASGPNAVTTEFSSELRIFPNPSNGRFSIEFTEEASGLIEVLDTGGRLLFSDTMRGSRISLDLDHLQAGFYLLRYTDAKQKLNGRILIREQ